jgi:hypothetical protein
MNEFLGFRKMITPVVVRIVFWIGVVACIIAGIIGIVHGITMPADVPGIMTFGPSKLSTILSGIACLILGPIGVRVYCELVMIAFRIYDTLTEIRDNTAPRATPPD